MWTLDGEGPLYQQVYRAARRAILTAELAPRTRVPSTRALAKDLGVSRNTVILAYDQLLAEGYIATREGSGTFVATNLPDDLTEAIRSDRSDKSPHEIFSPHLSSYAERIAPFSERQSVSWEARNTPLSFDFRYGRPNFFDFPHETWCRVLARRARRASVRQLDYGPPAGREELRSAIAEYLWRSRGVVCTPEQVIVVNGSQQALDLAARVLIDPGDRVVLEEPHYPGAALAFEAAGAEIIPAELDADGMRVDSIPDDAAVRLAYVTPAHQFPTGVSMPMQRRLEVLSWAEKHGALIFEDDYDSEFRYSGRPVEALQGVDRAGRVLYAGTFSKLMFPALRLGYLVLPAALVAPVKTAKAVCDTGCPALEQLALADFMQEGHFERHLRRSRARNARRREALLKALDSHFGDRIEVSGVNAGLHILVWLRGIAARRVPALRRRAAEQGVGVYPVTPYYREPPKSAGLLLGFASLQEKEIEEGIAKLARIVLAPASKQSSDVANAGDDSAQQESAVPGQSKQP